MVRKKGYKYEVQGTRKSIEPDYEIWLQTKKTLIAMPNSHIEHCEETTIIIIIYSVANATNGFDAVIMRLTLT